MSSEVKRDRAAKRDILQKAQERLAASQRVAEATRRSRARAWLGAHVVRDREYSAVWKAVMNALPVGRAGYDALCRSTTPCKGSVGR